MNYRNPKIEDAKEIAEIAKQRMIEELHKEFDFDKTVEHTKKNIKTYPIEYSFVAEEDENVVGYIFTKMEERVKGKCPVIGYFGVTKDFREQGIGTKLLELVLDALKEDNFKKVNLKVMIDNKEAIGLYEKFGFKKTNYLMKKSL